ncbi:MAG: sigma-70 family RNA polymerase sigma factor [Cyclobacteriaceae bacterium]
MTPAQTISTYHPVLQQVAMKLVRCKADAEDIVQDTFLKWLSIDSTKVKNTKAYLIKSVHNNCLNHLNSLKKRQEEYFDSFNFPEIINKFKEMDLSQMDLNIDLKAALSVINQKLEPLEKLVYLLREVFNMDYEALQELLAKKQDHCRQLFSRAKKKLEDQAHKITIDWNTMPKWVESFKKAYDEGFSQDLIRDILGDNQAVIKTA